MLTKKHHGVSRRAFLKLAAVTPAGLTLAGAISGQTSGDKKMKELLVYIGTYTSGKSKSAGIYIYKLNLGSGELKPYKIVGSVVEPSFLTPDKNRKFLYAVNETLEYEGQKSGAISSFSIDQETGDLKFVNKQPTLGGAPCFVIVSENEKFVLVANYVGGNVAVFPVTPDGSLGASTELIQNKGTGPNKNRQEAAHAHSINLDPHNKYAYLCDLGLDRIFIYEFDHKAGKLKPNPKQEFFQAKPGVGPRHLAFHQNSKFAYLINEMGSSVTALAWNAEEGTLQELQNLSTLPAGWSGDNTAADLHISPNGKFLYGSNRGHNSIAAYKIDEKTGRLEFIELTGTQGKTPRNFAIEPGGKFLLAANQNSDSIVVFRLDEKTGKLMPSGLTAHVPSPVCLKLEKF